MKEHEQPRAQRKTAALVALGLVTGATVAAKTSVAAATAKGVATAHGAGAAKGQARRLE